ncbi:MAG: ABC transporter ATP-binding protein/permease [Candidatus Lokiarchaeota archaeon]|nr:ABC transporter ATP-binding protein/permease [Candidatus Harpocratesius repetitus]
MVHITKYAKPYLPMILIAVGLLFAQANFDLALPDYFSRIVNVGIQQNGIEDAVPIAIRENQMNHTFLFMSKENKSVVLQAYELKSNNSADFMEYVEEFPLLRNESLYILTQDNDTIHEQLNSVMADVLLVVFTLEQIQANSTEIQNQNMNLSIGFDMSKIPPGMDLFTFLSLLPSEQLMEIRDSINQKLLSLGEDMIKQAAIFAVKAEYEAIGIDTDKIQMDYIMRIGGLMLLLTLLSAICTVIVGYLSAKTAAGMARDLRTDVFRKVESFSNAEFDQFSTASLITRTTNDITQIQLVMIMLIRLVVYAPILGIGGIIRAFAKDASMWWLIAIAVGFLISLVLIIVKIALPRFKSIQNLVDRLNLIARENLSGIMVIRAFNMQQFEEKRFDGANADLTGVSLYVNRVLVLLMPVMMFTMNALAVVIIWVGSHRVADANMQVGDMMAFMQYAIQIVMAFLMLSMMFIILPRATVSASRIAEVLSTEPTINDPTEPKTWQKDFQGKVEFDNVSFKYPGGEEYALEKISFTANPGQVTAFIGATGSGKSTLIHLLLRFYDVTEGAIKIDGIDIRDVTQHSLREKIGYVPQKSVLFSGTIGSNLKYADENADDDTLNTAISIAQAKEFVESSPEKYNTLIAQGGINVSGGQKQRLAIARALVKKAPINILDDSSSALDFKTDAALRHALKQEMGNKTLFLVTQRVSSVMNADQIIVLDEGKLVGKGTHRDLLETCEIYKEIALSQLALEELQ